MTRAPAIADARAARLSSGARASTTRARAAVATSAPSRGRRAPSRARLVAIAPSFRNREADTLRYRRFASTLVAAASSREDADADADADDAPSSSSAATNENAKSETITRLWSNLAPSPRASSSSSSSFADPGAGSIAPSSSSSSSAPRALVHAPGSVGGAIALVAGTTVGAGMLALPAVCETAGFVPSTTALILCWIYMVATGLCVLEVNLATMCELGGGGVSIVSMADRTLGVGGVRFAWASYVFIHYALLVAYVAKVGELAVDLIPAFPGGAPAASIEYVAALGGFLFLAESDAIERFNNALVVIVLALFFPLLALAGSAADPRNLIDRGDWTAVPDTIPVIALAFVFHNVIPVVSSSLEGDKSKIRVAIIAGTFIPFAMFALWDAAVLGSVGVDDVEAALRQGVKAPDPLATLQASSDAAKALVSGFSFFAVSTSFLGFVLGLTDFLADGMKTTSKGDAKPWAVALLPPTAFALAYPDIFLSALDKAGTFGVLTLFGCMPPLMAWRNREMQRRESPPEECELRGDAFACVVTSDVLDPIVPGGIVALGALGTLALAVVVNETVGDATGYLAARDF